METKQSMQIMAQRYQKLSLELGSGEGAPEATCSLNLDADSALSPQMKVSRQVQKYVNRLNH